MQKFELFTLNYPKFQPAMGVPIRTSNGHPRFVKYEIRHVVRELMPERAWIKMTDKDEFTQLYRGKLDRIGLDVIASRFRAIAVAEDEPRLVILCFEDLAKGDWCHRTTFAEWWQDMTGEKVRELGPAGPPPRTATLFD